VNHARRVDQNSPQLLAKFPQSSQIGAEQSYFNRRIKRWSLFQLPNKHSRMSEFLIEFALQAVNDF
jgi:hypothetical protein